MKLTRRSMFVTLLTPLVGMAGASLCQGATAKEETRDIADKLLDKLLQNLRQAGVKRPRRTSVSRLGEGDGSMSDPFDHEHLQWLMDAFIRDVVKYGYSEASYCGVCVSRDENRPRGLVFQLRTFVGKDHWPQPDGIVYYRTERIST